MDLSTLLSQQTDISAINLADGQAGPLALLSSPMEASGLRLSYDRTPDLSRLLKMQSPLFFSGQMLVEKSLATVFSFSFREKWIGGEKVSCAYAGDFRVQGGRKATREWRKHFASVVRAVKQDERLQKPKYILTAIMKDNVQAIRNIARAKKEFGVRYDFLTDLEMVNVAGRLLPTKSKIITQRAQPADLSALQEFLAACEKRKMFGSGFDSSGAEWAFKEAAWTGFCVDNFLLQKNQAGKIIACTLPFNPGFAKRMTVLSMPPLLRLARRILPIIGIRLPAEGEALETLYLTHLEISESEATSDSLGSFLNFIFEQKTYKFHLVSFASLPNRTEGLRRFIKFRTPISLFCISLPEEPVVSLTAPLSFEMSLV